ncbi:bifunctional tRNA pseudouridine(32) synthase/23S rRNA pseudouridine(746) synthase RluA [Vibrio sp. WJH972]
MAMLNYSPPTQPWVDIVFEDEYLLAVNKPSGLLSVPGREPQHYDSMWSRLVEIYPEIQVVHRLDMSTSGIMLLAKSKAAESAIKKQFQYRLTHKVYLAEVWGTLEQDQGEVDLPLICDWPNRPRQMVCHETGKPSQTHYQVVERREKTTLVRLFPITGRSHQLRVHMLAIGHPIVGDEFYAHDEAQAHSSRLHLHAAELSYYHPETNQVNTLFIPCDFFTQAHSVIVEYFQPLPTLPDYKTLPRP